MAHRAASSPSRLLAGRTVHIKTNPRTRNVHESREILRLLKGYGEVMSFRNLRYDAQDPAPHTIIAIFADAASASRLLSASPLRLTVPARPPPSQLTSPFGRHMSSLLDPGQPRLERDFHRDTPAAEFELRVSEATGDHAAEILRRRYYWGYSAGAGSLAEEALRRVVPIDGLAKIERSGAEVPGRIVRRNLKGLERRRGLWELYQEGLREEELRSGRLKQDGEVKPEQRSEEAKR